MGSKNSKEKKENDIANHKYGLTNRYLDRMERKYKLSSNIPQEIKSIIYSYAFYSDYWSKIYKHDSISINKDGTIISIDDTPSEFGLVCIYGQNIVNAGVYTWKLRLIEICDQNGSGWHINNTKQQPYVGIVRNDDSKIYRNDHVHWYHNGYLFCGGDSKKYSNFDINVPVLLDGKEIFFREKDDIIQFILDINKREISIQINDYDQILLFKDVIPGDYRFGFAMHGSRLPCKFQLL